MAVVVQAGNLCISSLKSPTKTSEEGFSLRLYGIPLGIQEMVLWYKKVKGSIMYRQVFKNRHAC
jgi:hypothetical protein